ncbi:hypothetical protein BGZ63DRAFT_195950 [Mariannaea sp. PMI_226]|nr:hypothetical protein BGZ63DRAFT_195950 [Mariannaea sp. PMI_226]
MEFGPEQNKMDNAHTSVAIAQVAFYTPLVPVTGFVLFLNWRNKPRQAWYPLFIFSLLRLIGGVVTIMNGQATNNLHPEAASLALLNIGLVAVLWSTLGIICLVLDSTAGTTQRIYLLPTIQRIALITSLILLIISAGFASSGQLSQAPKTLAIVGYSIVLLVSSLAVAQLAQLHSQRRNLGTGTLIYVQLAIATVPTLFIRIMYGLLFEATIDNHESIWNPIYGSSLIYIIMGLVPEYIALYLYIFLGFYRMRHPLPGLEGHRDIESSHNSGSSSLHLSVPAPQSEIVFDLTAADPPPYTQSSTTASTG